MLDSDNVRTILTSVAGATIIGIGGVAWNTARMTDLHDERIHNVQEHIAELAAEEDSSTAAIMRELSEIRKDVGEIKTDVAVLRERQLGKSGKPRS